MQDPVAALLLMTGGLGCIAGWGVCRYLTETRTYRLNREADAIKAYVVRGGRVPDGRSNELARNYFYLRGLDLLANVLLFIGVGGVALAQFYIS